MRLDVPQQQNYRTIGDSTLKVFQHVVEMYDFSFVLKVGKHGAFCVSVAVVLWRQHVLASPDFSFVLKVGYSSEAGAQSPGSVGICWPRNLFLADAVNKTVSHQAAHAQTQRLQPSAVQWISLISWLIC